MLRHILASFLAAVLLAAGLASARAAQIPIGVTGFNQDLVVGVGQTYGNPPLTATMDAGAGGFGGGVNTWYALGQNTSAPTTGLPMGQVVTSQSDPNTTLIFPTVSGSSPNALLIDSSNSGTLTLSTPAEYSTLALFGSTGSGTNTVSYTLHFAGGSTQTGTVTFPDWFGNSPVAYDANGRINGSGYDSVNSGNPNVYEEQLTSFVDPHLALDSISLSTSGGGHTGIFALSGTPVSVPEPNSLVLLGAGAMGCFLANRRRFFRRT